MEHQAFELERIVSEGRLESELMPLAQSVDVMRVLDEIRRHAGIDYAQPSWAAAAGGTSVASS
jgi:hypothetical protein